MYLSLIHIFSSLERIADHCSNVGVHVITHQNAEQGIDRHDYLREVHLGTSKTYAELYQDYDKKYYSRIAPQG